MPPSRPQERPNVLAIIIPTLNEADNIVPLHAELDQVMGPDVAWKMVIVDDDSRDATREQVRSLMAIDNRVHLIHRIDRRGLSSACLEGMASIDSDYLLVMDADLQHDATIIPLMLKALQYRDIDLVVGSRFKGNHGVPGLSKARESGSRGVNWAMKLLTKNDMTDPLSGFFMLPRKLYDETKYQVAGIGFKILIDIIMSAPRPLKIKEIGFQFRTRHAGISKLDISTVAEFAGLLIEKLSHGKFPTRFFMFICVGSIGAIIHFTIMAFLYKRLGIDFIYAQTAATYVAIAVNFLLNNAFTYRDKRLNGLAALRGLFFFALVCSVGAANNLIVAGALYQWGWHWLFAAATGTIYGSVWNYFMSSILVWFHKPRKTT